jgi:hypothetical protein
MLAPSAIRCLRLLKTPELLLKISDPRQRGGRDRRREPDMTYLRVSGIAMLTAGSQAHCDYAVGPGRGGAQAALSALTRPKGA